MQERRVAHKTVPYKVNGSTGSTSSDACELKRPAIAGVLCDPVVAAACANEGFPNRRLAASTAGATCLHGAHAAARVLWRVFALLYDAWQLIPTCSWAGTSVHPEKRRIPPA